MSESFPFYVYSGLLTKEHRKRIGSALWEFLWCIDKTTKEVELDGEFVGLVYGGKPIKLSQIANDLGIAKSTVHRNIEILEKEGYLIIIRAPYGIIIKVKNSKKWLNQTVRNIEQQPNKRKLTVRNIEQQPNKRKLTVRNIERAFENSNGRSENENSNIDKAIDKTNDYVDVVVEEAFEKSNTDLEGMPITLDAVPPELDADSNQKKISKSDYYKKIKDKYIQRRSKGAELSALDLDVIDELDKDNIPLSAVLEGIDKAFDDYKPKHKFDEIRSLRYCMPIIYDVYHSKKERRKPNAKARTESRRNTKENEPTDEIGYYDQFPGLVKTVRNNV